jgi:hypothetical protein
MKKLVCAAILGLFPLVSMAAPLTYLLHDVVFDDGGTASGSFTWSMETGASAISLTTTAGPSRPYAVTYTNQVHPGVLGVNFGFSLVGYGDGIVNYWSPSFNFNGPFAGAFYLTTGPDFYNAYSERDVSNTYLRNVVSGYVAPIPVPGAAWLFGSSLVAVFCRKRATRRLR